MSIILADYDLADDAETERRLAGPDLAIHVHREGEVVARATRDEANALVVFGAARPVGFEPGTLPSVKIVVRLGVGYDNLDLAGWAALGVPVCNVPDYGTSEVADHAIGLMLMLRRGLCTYHGRLKDDLAAWDPGAPPLVRRLRGGTFGVVGMGRIGIATAQRARAFGMRIAFHDPFVPSGLEIALDAQRHASLADLFAASDVVSLHVPGGPATAGLVDARVLASARRGLVLINTARGSVVDIAALEDAMRRGIVAGAGLDVLPEEPPSGEGGLFAAFRRREPWLEGRLVLTPHAAFYSPESLADLRRKAMETVLDYLREGRLRNCVNGVEPQLG
jgi:D-3-phosphoglycerate dehydrogenase/C-terminal binding protein